LPQHYAAHGSRRFALHLVLVHGSVTATVWFALRGCSRFYATHVFSCYLRAWLYAYTPALHRTCTPLHATRYRITGCRRVHFAGSRHLRYPYRFASVPHYIPFVHHLPPTMPVRFTTPHAVLAHFAALVAGAFDMVRHRLRGSLTVYCGCLTAPRVPRFALPRVCARSAAGFTCYTFSGLRVRCGSRGFAAPHDGCDTLPVAYLCLVSHTRLDCISTVYALRAHFTAVRLQTRSLRCALHRGLRATVATLRTRAFGALLPLRVYLPCAATRVLPFATFTYAALCLAL